jgi:hypothetical protein
MGRIVAVALITGSLSAGCSAQATIDQLWNRARVTAQSRTASNLGLTDSKISAGLKEALTVSTGKAVAATGRTDGFFKNEAIKILLPDNLRRFENGMRLVGMGAQVDQFELGMNRAAEQAAPQAKQILIDALTKMTFADAHQILTGGDTAATVYFKRQSSGQLMAAFTPIVHQSLENVGVIKQYNRMMQNAAVPFLNRPKFDLDQYVVDKTLDGLFYMLGQEERRIRTNPAAQTTALLKQVFGGVARKEVAITPDAQREDSGR